MVAPLRGMGFQKKHEKEMKLRANAKNKEQGEAVTPSPFSFTSSPLFPIISELTPGANLRSPRFKKKGLSSKWESLCYPQLCYVAD